ncbi:MAG TPA: bifunctional histidinol-phosphatase/imidazoleglycerol-phosphate dehydratase HisB [Woeseiaceae bacterium]|nr:bifunctional histidinol-phosphatase/imidazoleglycerol-phosphate dehydratase HisB [Woeseiaceae bacterium]
MEKVLFLDRDGTLIEEPEDNQVDALEKVRLVQYVMPSLSRLRNNGFRFVMVSNQDGLGSDAFPEESFERCHQHVLALFRSQGITFDRIFICPHRAEDGCGCRKPATGLLTRYLAEATLDLARCAVIGDRESDLELASNIGVRGLMVRPADGYERTWPGIADALLAGTRLASVVRETSETRIRVTVNLDADNPIVAETGIGFYDHMLEQIAKHGGFSLRLKCGGDLDVDEHHTVEDTAICLGDAMRKALGDKRGIGRYGFLLPMDESEAKVVLDLSGRASFLFDGRFPRDRVGGLPTELVPHFFRSFSESLGAALHIEVRGENTHHMVEACFKGVGRALRQAIRREGEEMPSTKGVLG